MFFDTDSIVLVQGIVVVDDGVLVAALHIDAAVLGVVVCCLAKFFLTSGIKDESLPLQLNTFVPPPSHQGSSTRRKSDSYPFSPCSDKYHDLNVPCAIFTQYLNSN